MRKYQQLLLLLFSFISLILVLVYRHEYNRLHYVLEVFNFFGTPCNFTSLKTSEKRLDHFDWGQTPVWQETGDSHVFSAFANKTSAQIIAVNKGGSNSPKKCVVWYEEENPTTGTMTAEKIAESDGLEAHVYNCGYKYHKNLPYAVSFGFRSKYASPKKIMLTTIKKSYSVKSTVCVPPSTYNKRELVEFLSFHILIGFKHFIFYYDDIPYSLISFLSNLQNILEVDLTFFPWNFPMHSSNITRSVIEKDCFFRTFGKSETFVMLELNEYLIPLDSYGIYPLLQTNRRPPQLNIPIQPICIQTNHTFQPIAVQNRNSFDDGTMSVKKFFFNSKTNKTEEETAPNSLQMVVNSYRNCEGYTGRFTNDKSISLYSTDFRRTLLMGLLTHGGI